MSKKYDVIIIGAGIGGLTAGAILARNGKKVLILEKNPMVGGYAVNFRRKGYVFDASIHLLNGCQKGATLYKNLVKSGISSKVKFEKPKFLYRSIYPDFDFRVPQNDPIKLIRILKGYFPKEAEGLDNLLIAMSGISYDIRQSFKKSPYLISFLNKNFEYVLDKYLNDKRLKAIISQLWVYDGLPPSKLSAFSYFCLWYDYLKNGGVYPIGGSANLSEKLKSVIISNNGAVLFNAKVSKILLNKTKAIGVKTDSGKFFSGEKIVANIDARTIFNKLIKNNNRLIGKTRISINKMSPSISLFQVYVGVDRLIRKINSLDFEIFVNPDYNLNSQYLAARENSIKKTPFAVTLYYNLNKFTSNTASISVLSGYDYWNNLDDREYEKRKQQFSDVLIEQTEKILPGFKKYIKTIETATPLTMERYTGNYKGAIYGWSQEVEQSGIRRLDQFTDIENLYLASAWTYPGGGIAGVVYSGEQVANRILSTDN